MNRKDFLKSLGAGALAIFGAAKLAKFVEKPKIGYLDIAVASRDWPLGDWSPVDLDNKTFNFKGKQYTMNDMKVQRGDDKNGWFVSIMDNPDHNPFDKWSRSKEEEIFYTNLKFVYTGNNPKYLKYS